MNERIRLLAEQANELDYETFDEYNHKTVKHYKFNREKFAELIVAECVQSIEKTIATNCDTDSEKMGCEFAITDLLEHFGVDE